MEDWAILDLFFTRSEYAIVELDAKYGALFHSLALNILNSSQDAEECVNDAYLGAWNAMPPVRPNTPYRPSGRSGCRPMSAA